MRISYENVIARFFDPPPSELTKLEKLLTWKETINNREINTTLLFRDKISYYTYLGLLPKCGYEISTPIYPSPTIDEIKSMDKDLYDFQVAGIEKALKLHKGLIVIPTGGGKTRIIQTIIKFLLKDNPQYKILVITPTITLSEQFRTMAVSLGIPSSLISVVHSNSQFNNTPIVVGVINSLYKALQTNSPLTDFIKQSNAVILDECQHAKAKTYADVIINTTQADFILGFSGSPFKNPDSPLKTPDDAIILGLFQRVIFQITHSYLYSENIISRPIVSYYTIPGKLHKFVARYETIYNSFITKNTQRNKIIIDVAKKFNALNLSVLILVSRLEHAKILLMELNNAICVFGNGEGYIKNNEFIEKISIDYEKFRQEFNDKKYLTGILSPVGDEGIDLTGTDALILAGAGRSRIKIFQRVGRGMRKKKNTNNVFIIDFFDRTHVYLFFQSKRRQQYLKEMDALFTKEIWKYLTQKHVAAPLLT